MPSEKYAHGPEILEQCRRIGRQYGLYDKALFHTQIREIVWDQARQVWEITTDRDDRFTGQICRDRHRSAAYSQAARHPGHRDVRGQVVPHQPLGLCLYRRRCERRADDGTRRQARGDHRHRRDIGPGGAAPRPRREGTLRRPAHAVRRSTSAPMRRSTRTGSPASQPPAGRSAGWRISPPTRPPA